MWDVRARSLGEEGLTRGEETERSNSQLIGLSSRGVGFGVGNKLPSRMSNQTRAWQHLCIAV